MPRKVLRASAQAPRADGAIQVEVTLPVRQRCRSQPSSDSRPESLPRIPRISRLMALAIKFQEMVDRGEVSDYADLARLGYVTRARITQIMNLLLLAPDIQESLLSPSPTRLQPTERQLRSAARHLLWSTQRLALGMLDQSTTPS